MKLIDLLRCAAACSSALVLTSGCHFIRNDNLNQAIVRGDTEGVSEALTKGVNVNGRGMHSMTPLMAAAGSGRLDICKLLVMHGADVNGHNDSASVLMMAVGSRNEEVVRFILASGADRAWTNAIGQTAEEQARQRRLVSIAELVNTQ